MYTSQMTRIGYIPAFDYGNLSWVIYAQDRVGNWRTSSVYRALIARDAYPPLILDQWFYVNGRLNLFVNSTIDVPANYFGFEVVVADENLDTVFVQCEVRSLRPLFLMNVNLTLSHSDPFDFNSPYEGVLHLNSPCYDVSIEYQIFVNDTYGHVTMSRLYTISIESLSQPPLELSPMIVAAFVAFSIISIVIILEVRDRKSISTTLLDIYR
jgi:hypothetical protein